MKKPNTIKLMRLATIFLLAVSLFSACKKEDETTNTPPEEPTESHTFTLFSFIEDFAYLSTFENPDSGSVSVIGNGLELNTYGVGVVQHDEHYYVWNSAESTIDQYNAQGTSITKSLSLAVSPLIPDERPRVMRTTDDDKLILNSWPDSKGNVYYALISLPDFNLETKGNVQLDSLGSIKAKYAEFAVAGNKAYLGTGYLDNDYEVSADSTITWVYDYPSFTNGKMLVTASSSGCASGYVGFSNITDEKGDVYQAPINSEHWGYDGDAYILKLSNGDYDNSYQFNLSDALGKTIGLWGIMYAENGIAYAKVVENDASYGFGPLRQTNTVTIVKIDLYNKIATEINLPESRSFFLQHGAVDNGNFYLPISFVDGETNIYGFDIDGGANDFTKGTKFDGESILTGSVFKH